MWADDSHRNRLKRMTYWDISPQNWIIVLYLRWNKMHETLHPDYDIVLVFSILKFMRVLLGDIAMSMATLSAM